MSFYKSYITLLLPAICLCLPGRAANPSKSEAQNNQVPGIVEKISEGFEDYVELDIPEDYLNELVKDKVVVKRNEKNIKKGINKIEGYRIQIFGDGNNQSTLEARARARGNAVVAKFPKYRGQVYAFSSSPNWYTRIGNFKEQSEAAAALAELKRAFPQYANEMRVVKSLITLIK